MKSGEWSGKAERNKSNSTLHSPHSTLYERGSFVKREEVKKIIDYCYSEAERILKENIDILHKSANLLLEKEKVTGEEFAELFSSAE